MTLSDKKIAIVYDWIDSWGGVERVLLFLHALFPNASFYSSYVDQKKARWADELRVSCSFIHNLPRFIKSNRRLSFPLYPYAFESFNFSEYDIVISVSSSFAKAVITKPETFHICYLLTPTRYLWVHPNQYISSLKRRLISPYWNWIQKWDKTVSHRPDKIITLSQHIAQRTRQIYNRKSEVIYPPFDLIYWKTIKKKTLTRVRAKKKLPYDQFFLLVSRLEPYKRVDLAIQACNAIKKNLIIVGKGTQMSLLKSVSGSTIEFRSDISDEDLGVLYQTAQALIIPQKEDFGYVAVEAQFMGCPVIAFNQGGVTEIVRNNETGVYFSEQTTYSLLNVLESFDRISYNLKDKTVESGERLAKRFDGNIFKKKLLTVLNNEEI